jgi:hypothetical protein
MSEIAFEIGFDHYRFNLPLDISRFYDNYRNHVRDGYTAAETLKVTRKKPDRFEKKLMGIRDRALVKGLEVSISANDLRERYKETKGFCPITLEPFTFAENDSTDWSVDRVDNSRGYCRDNIVIVSVVANQAKSNLDLSAIIKQGLMPSDTESFLTDLEWLRMAPCLQQKCWAHLIRDLNENLRKSPFDKEYENFVCAVGELITLILQAVEKYGLKTRHLRKFKLNVDSFYEKFINDNVYTSDTTKTFQKRFIKYREKLFVFLDIDGIPWNNNAVRGQSDIWQFKERFQEPLVKKQLPII